MRRPNNKKWICPIDGKVINSRGAPAYLRNKYNISCNKRFLRYPELLCEKATNVLYGKIIGLFADIRVEDKELKSLTMDELYKLIVRIRINLRNNDTSRILEIHKYIYPITSSKLVIKRRE